MKSSPKAIALGVVFLEVIICILIYYGCACIRRWRQHRIHHQQQQQQYSQRQRSKVSSKDTSLSNPAIESVFVFFPYSLAKTVLGKTVTSLSCANCLYGFKDEDETLRLIPKCGHVFHPMCLVDPCSATCPYCLAGPELIGLEPGFDPDGESDEGRAEAETEGEGEANKVEVKFEIEVEVDKVVKDEEVLEIKVEENKIIRLPQDLMMKIIIHAKLVLPTGKICSPTHFLRR